MAHPVDKHVGKRLRERRWMLKMTQQQLAEKVGIRFQQIQKYETGVNRVSASRLWDISDALDVPVSYFFEGAEGMGGADQNGEIASHSGVSRDSEAQALVQAYYNIPETQRKRLFDLARVLSESAA